MIIRIIMPAGNVVHMDMEEYLKGVVCVEMYTSWPMEALKAQAIAARTYAAWYVINNDGRGSWDCTTTTAYQAYVSWRNTRTNQAVEATRGITGGTRDTALIRKTYFSSSCGGHTLNNWGPSWLRSTACPCGRGVLGHRNGLCQYGAKALAEMGYTCFQILDFYYNLAWYGAYLQLGPVAYDTTPDNPWTGVPTPPVIPPFVPEPTPDPTPPVVVPPYVIGQARFWREFGNVLFWIAVKLGFLADAIKDVPVVGRLFYTTIDTMAITVDDLGLYVHEFEPEYLAVLAFIRDMTGLTLLNTLIQQSFGEWNSFRYNPRDWVFNKVVDVWPDFYWFIQNPHYMVEFWLLDRWPWIHALRDSPRDWVLGWVDDIWPDFYWFRQNPGYMIQFWLTDRVPGLREFLEGPRAWLVRGVNELTGSIQQEITDRLLHIIQDVIERHWDRGED